MTISVHRPARIVALLTVVVVIVVLLLARGVGASTGDTAPDEFISHQVAAGDTLWDIAARYAEPGDDIRKAVFTIRRANHLSGSIIVPGQELLIPTG
jgi:hypothetical protein